MKIVDIKLKWRYKILGFIREIEYRIRRLAERLDYCYICNEEADEWCESCVMRICYDHAVSLEDCQLCDQCWLALEDELKAESSDGMVSKISVDSETTQG